MTATLGNRPASVVVTTSLTGALARSLLWTLPLLAIPSTKHFLIEKSGLLHLAYMHLFTGPIPSLRLSDWVQLRVITSQNNVMLVHAVSHT